MEHDSRKYAKVNLGEIKLKFKMTVITYYQFTEPLQIRPIER